MRSPIGSKLGLLLASGLTGLALTAGTATAASATSVESTKTEKSYSEHKEHAKKDHRYRPAVNVRYADPSCRYKYGKVHLKSRSNKWQKYPVTYAGHIKTVWLAPYGHKTVTFTVANYSHKQVRVYNKDWRRISSHQWNLYCHNYKHAGYSYHKYSKYDEHKKHRKHTKCYKPRKSYEPHKKHNDKKNVEYVHAA